METNNKIRAALEQAKDIARTIYSTSETGSPHEDLAEKIVELANAALAEPVRNYEVGTADEQALRFVEFCGKHHTVQGRWICHECPCKGNMNEIPHCLTKWAQMPYKEGGDK